MVEKARENGEISLIGNELPILERDGPKLYNRDVLLCDLSFKYRNSSASSSKSVLKMNADGMVPLGEIHLQVKKWSRLI